METLAGPGRTHRSGQETPPEALQQLLLFTAVADEASYGTVAPLELLALPAELLLSVAHSVLTTDATGFVAALRLCQTSKALFVQLEAVRLAANRRQLRWLSELTTGHIIEGRKVKRVDSENTPWATGGPLPMAGRSSWLVRVEHSRGNSGDMHVGVCDAAARCCWGLFLSQGRITRMTRDAEDKSTEDPPPDGFPCGDSQLVTQCTPGSGGNDLWEPSTIEPSANGAVIEVRVDHGAGTLSYRINDEPSFEALKGFPPGAALRPWVRGYHIGDCFSFARPYTFW